MFQILFGIDPEISESVPKFHSLFSICFFDADAHEVVNVAVFFVESISGDFVFFHKAAAHFDFSYDFQCIMITVDLIGGCKFLDRCMGILIEYTAVIYKHVQRIAVTFEIAQVLLAVFGFSKF